MCVCARVWRVYCERNDYDRSVNIVFIRCLSFACPLCTVYRRIIQGYVRLLFFIHTRTHARAYTLRYCETTIFHVRVRRCRLRGVVLFRDRSTNISVIIYNKKEKDVRDYVVLCFKKRIQIKINIKMQSNSSK